MPSMVHSPMGMPSLRGVNKDLSYELQQTGAGGQGFVYKNSLTLGLAVLLG